MENWKTHLRRFKFLLECVAALIIVLGPIYAFAASTVILSTTTYPGLSQTKTSVIPVALPKPGVYVFDLVADSTAAAVAWTSLQVYLQQEGLSRGTWYTLPKSTFTACTAACGENVYPDLYIGGRVRAQWTLTGSSVTFVVTAREVSP